MKRAKSKKRYLLSLSKNLLNLAQQTRILLLSLYSFLSITVSFFGSAWKKNCKETQPISRKKGKVKQFFLTAFTAFMFTLSFSGINLWWTSPALANTNLSIEVLTWDMIGLDSNNPSVGPNQYLTGARVCNVGSQAAQNVNVKFIREGSNNPYLQIKNSLNTDTWVTPILNPGPTPSNHHAITNKPSNCFDAYYIVTVQRTSAAFNTVQRYRIEATADNAAPVNTNSPLYDTPHPRQLYVTKILSQARNDVLSFSGASTVYVGETYEFHLKSKTATAYPQLTISSDFPNIAFQILNVRSEYEIPPAPNNKNSSVYADACGWISDPTYPGYLASSSVCNYPPVNDPYTGGKVGGIVDTYYTIKILSTGSSASSVNYKINHLILDFSGGSYHYNADYGSGIGVGATDITVVDRQADISITKSHTGNFSSGDNIYTLTVNNAGPSIAKGTLTVSDTLPTGLTFNPSNTSTGVESGTSTGWTCSAVNQTITCTNPNDLGIGSTSTIRLKVQTNKNTPSYVLNTATVSSSTTDPNLTNNTASDPTNVVQGPNLILTKDSIPSNAIFTAGTTATYRLTLSNTSGFDAAGPLTIVDTLPPELTFKSFSGTGWACNANNQTVTCTNPNGLNNGSTASVDLVVNVNSNYPNPLTNIASSTSGSIDTNSADNTNIKKDNNTATPDLTVIKSDRGVTFTRQGEAIYTIKVTNAGVATTLNPITVTDTLPAQLLYRGFSGTGWACTTNCTVEPTTTTRTTPLPITFSHPGPLAPGQSLEFNITVYPTSSAPNSVKNTVQVSTIGDGNQQLKSHSIDTPVGTKTNQSPDLAVSKTVITAPTSPIAPGNKIEYQITVTATASGATDVVKTGIFEDIVPSAITFISSDVTCNEGTGGKGNVKNSCGTKEISGNTIKYTNFTLSKNGGSITINIVGTVSATGTIVNTASAIPGSSILDANPADNVSTVPITVPGANLSLSKTSSGNFTQGVSGKYYLTVKNESTTLSTTAPITVTDTLPSSLTFISATSSSTSSGWACTHSSGKVTCTNNNSLAAQSTSTIEITVIPTTSTTTTPLKNNASVSMVGDGNPNDNNASVETGVAPANPDVYITKTAGTLALGHTGTYVIKVQNIGTTVASAPIKVTDTLPAGLTFLSGTGAGWSCSATGQTVVCTNYSNIAANAFAPDLSLNVLVGLGAPASVNNTAKVDAVPYEASTKLSNNTTTITNSVVQSADLSINKTLIGNLVAGENATYQLDVKNNGPSNVPGVVTVKDNLTSGLTFQSFANNTVWACKNDTTGNACVAGDTELRFEKTTGLSVGATSTITLNVAVSSSTSGTISNTASVSSQINDPEPTNNSKTVNNSVSPLQADLAINKTHFGSFTLGGQGTYTLSVTNNGPATAKNIQITDNLPSNLTLLSSLGADWVCTGTGTPNVICTYAKDLTSGNSTAVDITVSVGSGTPVGTNSITNTATVSSSTPDPTSNNNTKSDPTTIQSSADLSITKTHTGTFLPGTTGTYTLTVKNNSPAAAGANIVVTDDLPLGVQYVSYSSSDFSCSNSGNSVTCTRTSAIAANSSSTITLTVNVLNSATSPIENSAVVGSTSTPDPNQENNVATDIASFGPDLTITKTHAGDFAPRQTDAVYTVTVRNIGAAASSGTVTMIDDLPKGLIYKAIATPSGWNCSTTANTPSTGQTRITCTTSSVLAVFNSSDAASTSYPFTLTVDVAEDAASSVTNVATISGGGQTNTTNDIASDPTNIRIAGQGHLILVKRITAVSRNGVAINNYNGQPLNQFNDDGTPNNNDNNSLWPNPLSNYLRGAIDGGRVMPGDEVEYTIYFLSDGDKSVENVRICDLVPSSSTFVANAFNSLSPTDGGTAGADSGIAIAWSSTSLPTAPTAYLSNIADADRGRFFRPGSTPSTSCSGQNSNGAVVVNVTATTPVSTIPHAIAAGTPSNSYGFIRFRAQVK